MRRYRYGDPSKFSFKKYSTYAYVFLAWNLLGYMIYKVWYKKKEETTPQWETMSSTEKYLSMMSISKNIEKVKISGFKIEENKNTDSSVE